MVDYQAMGNRMKTKRKSLNISQEAVASAIQISASYYGNIERGRRIPSIDTLVAIANALGVGLDYLLADSVKAADMHRSEEETRVLIRYLREQMAELNFGTLPPKQP